MEEDKCPRVPFIETKDQMSADQRHHFESIEESRGSIRGPFKVLLNSPDVAGKVGELGAYLRFESGLAGDQRELAIITTAREFDCAYEWAAHEPIAREVGVRAEAIDVIASQSSTDNLTEIEALIVSYGRELFQTHSISDSTFQSASDQFGVQGVTELTATMGYYSMLACVLNAFEVVPDESSPLFS